MAALKTASVTVRSVLLAVISIAALPVAGLPQQQESLGDLARQVRAQKEKQGSKPSKVFTNDNLPAPRLGEAVTQTAPAQSSAATGTAPPPPAPTSAPDANGNPPESAGGPGNTREYWQARFKAARQNVAQAKEQQQLAEDELNLLDIQQAREIDADVKADLATKVQSKQSEIDADQNVTDAAQKALDDLEKAFKASGNPDDWSTTEDAESPS